MKTLTPAYGRDYKTATAAEAAYSNGDDFILNDITSRWDGKPCSIRDFPGEAVKLRFNRNQDFTIFTGKARGGV